MTITRLGFTGTREGMPHRQLDALKGLLIALQVHLVEVHHGCCVGADVQFHDVIRRHWPKLRIHGHPATTAAQQDGRVVADCDVLHGTLPPLVRNKGIVAAVDALIGAPYQGVEQLRSGTWMALRYAAKRIPFYIITPAGSVRDHI